MVVDAQPEEKREVAYTQQNFFAQKLDLEEEVKVKDVNSDDEAVFSKPKYETGVLFGAAYENTFIDILENEDVENETEINERLLEMWLGMDKDDLRKLEKIEIVVDTTNTHMQHVGEVLQSLTSLKLNDSVIPSVRDLGTSFRNLRVLSLNRCEVKSLAGLSSFEFLKELYASYNDIQDLFDISYWYHLEVLDLEGNNVSTWDNVSYLMGLDQLMDINLSWNPISSEQNYQNRVKEMLRQVKYIDDDHVDAIEPEDTTIEKSDSFLEEINAMEEKIFVLSKFAKFQFLSVDDLQSWAEEALKWIHEEDDEGTLIKKKVKRHDRKNEAFEKETFEVFDYNDDELENEELPDDSTPKDVKKKMWRSWTNGFFKRRDSELSPSASTNRNSAYDDSDSIFRSSLKGFFTGKNTNNKTANESSNSTRETNDYSSLVTNNDMAFSGNPLKALKHNRKNMFSNYGAADVIEAKGIEELINDFNINTDNFKKSMKSIDFAQKLKQNNENNKLKECMELPIDKNASSAKLPRDSIKLSTKIKKDIKVKPIKADHIIIKKSMVKLNSLS